MNLPLRYQKEGIFNDLFMFISENNLVALTETSNTVTKGWVESIIITKR